MQGPTLIDPRQGRLYQTFDYRKFYPYHTKPKLVPIIKKIIGGLFAVTLSVFVLSNLIAIAIDYSGKSVYYGVLQQAVFFLYPFIALYAIYRYLQRKNYDSQKYSVSILFTAIIIVYNSFWIWRLLSLQGVEQIKDSSAFTVWTVFNLLGIVLLILTIALQITLVIIRPKIDYDKMRKIQEEMRKKTLANLEGKEYEIDLTGLD